MVKKQKEQTEKRYIYVKDSDLSVEGFATWDLADAKRKEMEGTLSLKKDRDGNAVDCKLRVCFRNRTNLFDVLVKVKTEVKAHAAPTAKEIQEQKDLEFMAHHAQTGE